MTEESGAAVGAVVVVVICNEQPDNSSWKTLRPSVSVIFWSSQWLHLRHHKIIIDEEVITALLHICDDIIKRCPCEN